MLAFIHSGFGGDAGCSFVLILAIHALYFKSHESYL